MKGLRWIKSKKLLLLFGLLVLCFVFSFLFIGSSVSAVSVPQVRRWYSNANGNFENTATLPVTMTASGGLGLKLGAVRFAMSQQFSQISALRWESTLKLQFGGDEEWVVCGEAVTYQLAFNDPCPVVAQLVFNDGFNSIGNASVNFYKPANSRVVDITFDGLYNFTSPTDMTYAGVWIGDTVGWNNGSFLGALGFQTVNNDTITIVSADLILTPYAQNQSPDYTDQLDNINESLNEQNQREQEGIDNITGQQNPGVGDDSTGTNIIGYLGGFVSAVLAISPTNCNLNMDTGYVNIGNVNLCSGGLPTLVPIVTSVVAVSIFIPYAYSMIRRILSEIRSFTSG